MLALRETFERELEENYNAGEIAGRSKGQIIGFEEGKKQNKIEIAKKMIKEGIDVDIICRVTGLNKKQIEKI